MKHENIQNKVVSPFYLYTHDPPGKNKNMKVFWWFQGDEKETLGKKGRVL